MAEEKKKRLQLSKAEKRVLAEEATRFAAADTLQRKVVRDAKTEQLRNLRLAREAGLD